MMILALFTQEDGEQYNVMYYSWETFHGATFNPYTNYSALLFKIYGKTYAERKESLRNLAVEYQHSDVGGLYMSDYAALSDFFTEYGRRYGLLREFRENAII